MSKQNDTIQVKKFYFENEIIVLPKEISVRKKASPVEQLIDVVKVLCKELDKDILFLE